MKSPVLIEYEVSMIKTSGPYDNTRDFNCFWMSVGPILPPRDIITVQWKDKEVFKHSKWSPDGDQLFWVYLLGIKGTNKKLVKSALLETALGRRHSIRIWNWLTLEVVRQWQAILLYSEPRFSFLGTPSSRILWSTLKTRIGIIRLFLIH